MPLHACVRVFEAVCVCVCLCDCASMRVCAYVCVCISVWACLCVCMFMSVVACVFLCVCNYVRVFVSGKYVERFTYTVGMCLSVSVC